MENGNDFADLHHVCIVVKNIDKAMAYYKSLGIGPFSPPPIKAIKETYLGKPIPPDYFKRKEVLGKMGKINLQLCQPAGGDSPWQEFIDKKGEGIHHLGYFVDDIEKEQTALVKRGIEIILSSRFEGGGGAFYADLSKNGSFYIEFIQPPKGKE
jgi:methylmalonyl-CoA/ethylmalonyl-CoA epimerase